MVQPVEATFFRTFITKQTTNMIVKYSQLIMLGMSDSYIITKCLYHDRSMANFSQELESVNFKIPLHKSLAIPESTRSSLFFLFAKLSMWTVHEPLFRQDLLKSFKSGGWVSQAPNKRLALLCIIQWTETSYKYSAYRTVAPTRTGNYWSLHAVI